ncbi:phosphatidate cytidylyltransferase [Sphingobium algorifonticola]|uniref:Phosphatidate cytidylyltransferase n=1 Tax=Sphingobium algorifonticola TaxID=2008318 RepID=A0A437J9C3_9SPHN|nr:phosphatidate cytidylyltransferase [Sphingobium algorifonticola]RVT42091.1 phosphatidate cytidylyltransferase [Sphingobium algorifonticola]
MTASRPSDLRTRAIVGVALICVAVAALLMGHILFWMLVSVAGVLMQAEWAGLIGADRKARRLSMFAISVPLAIMAPDPLAAGPSFLSVGLLMGAALFVLAITRSVRLALGIFYVGIPVLALLFLRAQPVGVTPGGLLLAFWALGLVWATDIGAYFAGRSIGGPKLAPTISPSKTWAGLLGGVVAALAFGFALHQLAGLPARFAAACGILAVAAQAGDLFESAMKRRAGVKDSGTLLPGHGGVLDRLDGVVTVAPLAALLVAVPGLL